jgi:hypothetical protein
MARSPKRGPSEASPDVEEIAPARFLIRDLRAAPFLKGEGQLRGRIFELTSWRRDGLLARLRGLGLSVASLDDQVAQLPGLPPAPADAARGWRALVSPTERFSTFAPYSWRPIEPTERSGRPGIVAQQGRPLRRRKARGPANFYTALVDTAGRLELRSADETDALLAGYAIAQASQPPAVRAVQIGEWLHLPDLALPPPHRGLLERFAEHAADRWVVPETQLALARALFARLGLEMDITK